MVRRQAELDLACIQTVSTLLAGLRLQPLDGSTGADSGLAISRLFTKYLNFFVTALEKAVAAEVCSIEPLICKICSAAIRINKARRHRLTADSKIRTPKNKGIYGNSPLLVSRICFQQTWMPG